MFSVTESGSGVRRSGWEERNMWVIWEITHISFSQPCQHPPASYSVFLLMKAVRSSETWNTHLQNGVETKENYHLINNHYENMKNYIPGTCKMEGWAGFQSQCCHVDREKNSCLWKEQNPGMPIHFTV